MISAETGVHLNLRMISNGATVADDGKLLKYSSGSVENPYRMNLSPGFYAAVEVKYPMGRMASIYAKPFFIYRHKSMTKSSYALLENPFVYGVNVGMSVKLIDSK